MMTRYFFHRIDGEVDPDLEGRDCEDLQAARIEAVSFAAATVRDNPDAVWAADGFSVEVTDARGAIVTTITISAADAPSMQAVLRKRAD